MAKLLSALSGAWSIIRKPSVRYSVLTLAGLGFVGGIVFWGGFNTVMEATNTMPFCTSCHEMRDNVYREYQGTIHASNRTGVSAVCSDCHVPKDWTHKMMRKIQASNEVWHWLLGTVDTPEKFDAKRLTLAKHEWDRMKSSDSRECRNCHTFEGMNPEFQKPRARKSHMSAMEAGNTCIDCHKGIAHKNVRTQLSDAELEQLERPLKEYARAIPEQYTQGAKRADLREAAEAEKKRTEIEAAAKSMVSAMAAKAAPATTGAPAAAPASGTFGAAIDWAGVKPTSVTLFYPGQSSFEWIQSGRDHGGARSFLKSGDRCMDCHAKELVDIGQKIVTGEKLEPTPIPGKRGSLEMKVQSAYDAKNVYFRFQWSNAAHTPAPFVPGGKMDPDHQVKLALTLMTNAVERAEQAGCWTTCHHDARTMPDAPNAEALAAFSPAVIDVKAGVTKYLAESRTAMEIKGGDAPRGGWDKVKPKAELEALAASGTVAELLRFRSNGSPEHGTILGSRIMTGGTPIEASGTLAGDTWTVVIARPLDAKGPGEIKLALGTLYNINFALHDDHTSARFHHVSMQLKFGLDAADAEINAGKK